MTNANLRQTAPADGAQAAADATATGCDAIHDQASTLERMQLALEAGRTGIWDWNLVTGELHLDARTRALWGLADDVKASFDIFRNALHPQDKKRTKEAVDAVLDPNHEGDYEVEYRVIGQTDRIERWISVRGRTYFENGRAVRILGTARDVTSRKHREQLVHELMRELVHRSKNLLAVVQAMARQTAMGAPSLEDFQRKFAARLQALSLAHDLLVSQNWRGASMHDLVRAQMAYCLDVAPGDVGEHAIVAGPAVMLSPEAAQHIGLALHELATNALTHGALSRPEGRVELRWIVEAEEFRVEWREFGGPTVARPPCEGFGHKVAKRLVALALDGVATLSYPPEGFVWCLSIPAKHTIAK